MMVVIPMDNAGGNDMEKCLEFILPENIEHDFIKFINHAGAVLISAASAILKPQVIRCFYRRGENIFWKKVYVAKKEEVDNIDLEYIESCNHYIISDTYKAPVLEIRRSGYNNQNMLLWASMYYNDGTQMVYKGQDFERLYKTIETWIRLNCKVIGLIFP